MDGNQRFTQNDRKARYTKHDGVVPISAKNHLENGIDINCFKTLDLIVAEKN